MPKYRVEVYELHSRQVLVRATTPADAIRLVGEGRGKLDEDSLCLIEDADKYGASMVGLADSLQLPREDRIVFYRTLRETGCSREERGQHWCPAIRDISIEED